MVEKKYVHVISHSHWDREWYLPFEEHRVRLVKLMDTLLELLNQDPQFASFHLDGQTIVLDDYLQIRPDKKDEVTRLIREGRLHIGPWYVLQDEFLTSPEANIRNLQIGINMAREFGPVCMIGYFPDSFGNMGQAPQILRQAGIDCAVFGRGVKATGFNNSVEEAGSDYVSPYSEMEWESPDGSKVLGILFANWYHNGMEIPVEDAAAREYWETRIAKAEKFASTPHLLFMNGCDHQPVQTNLSEALRRAKELFPDVEFVHSNFIDYIRSVQSRLPERLTVVSGELRSQRTDGWNTLVNTASARVYIKQENQRCQTLLEKAAEPLAALAVKTGSPYPHHLLTYAWKTLMQNHPHDSICGCSVDEVHREMMSRFAKSRQVAESIISDGLRSIAGSIDTSGIAADDGEAVPFAVFNTTGWARTGLVSAELDVQKVRFDGMNASEAYRSLAALQIGKGSLIDAGGNGVPFQMEDLGVHFHYELPDEAFRRRYWVRRIKVTFEAADVPALGYAAYVWSSQEPECLPEPAGLLKVSEREMENDWLKVAIAGNGSLILTDKASGRTYADVLVYEDTGDIGNEYMFKQPDGDVPLTTAGLSAKISLAERSPLHAVFEVVHEWELPARANDDHYEDIRQMANFRRGRSGQRVKEKVPFVITTRIALERSSRNVKITVSFDNQAKDHRLRVLMPTDLQADHHTADSIFEAARRSNSPSPEWTNPSYCHHQQAFVDIAGDGAGITIANRGLNEYEVLRDGRNTLAITLLRAVAELGDWGVFPTPEAQCLGRQTMEFALIPHAGDGIESGSYIQAYQYQVPWFSQQTGVHKGSLPAAYSMMSWKGPSLALSAVKRNEETGDLIVRWFNLSHRPDQLCVKLPDRVQSVSFSNVLEERVASLPCEAGEAMVNVSPCQIITLSFAEE